MATKIEWVQNPDGTKGETWNPITGCSKISAGCRNCYAERMAKRLAGRYGYPEQPHHFDVTFHEDKLNQPLKWKKPRMIFVCSMGDLFHDDVKEEEIMKVFDAMCDAPQHTYQILTKRPERMKWIVKQYTDYIWQGIPSNIWLGITAENQEAADERIPWLLRTPAVVHFVSVEPMLGPIDLSNFQPFIRSKGGFRAAKGILSGKIEWTICGGETGHGAREMKAEWAFNLYQQCREADIPFFFKKEGDAFKGSKINLPNVRQWPEVYE
jgi:protein gp37